MSDDGDTAQARQAEFNARHLEEHARRAKLDAPGADLCAECQEPIPAERRRALPSAYRCVGCQAFIERIGRIQKLQHA